MSNEMAQELTRLPRHEAYAKVIQVANGKQVVLASRVRTMPPPTPVANARELEREAIGRGHLLYCREREQIEAEIRQRRARWVGGGPTKVKLEEPPPTHMRGEPTRPVHPPQPDHPPPTQTRGPEPRTAQDPSPRPVQQPEPKPPSTVPTDKKVVGIPVKSDATPARPAVVSPSKAPAKPQTETVDERIAQLETKLTVVFAAVCSSKAPAKPQTETVDERIARLEAGVKALTSSQLYSDNAKAGNKQKCEEMLQIMQAITKLDGKPMWFDISKLRQTIKE